jgi:hypothetical protein
VDHLVQVEMFRLNKNAQYKLVIVSLKSYCLKFLIVKSLNTHFLTLHFEDVLIDANLLTSHILCLNETRIKNVHLNSKNTMFYHTSSIYYHDMINMALWYFVMTMCHCTTITNSGAKFITMFFNDNT